MLATPHVEAGTQIVQASDLSWNVVASGGTTMSSSSYTLMGTTGQPAAGETVGTNYSLLGGYWADFRTFLSEAFLPSIFK